MRTLSPIGTAALVAGGLLTPAGVTGQDATVVAHTITVDAGATRVELTMSDNTARTIELADGVVRINGQDVARYTPGDALWTAWRGVVDHADAQSPAELVETIRAWEPVELVEAQRAVPEQFAAALAGVAIPAAPNPPVAPATLASSGTQTGPLTIDLAQPLGPGSFVERLEASRTELERLDAQGLEVENGRVHLGDLTVARGRTIDGNIAVLAGDVSIYGTVAGNLVAVDGDVILRRSGHVEGDVVTVNGTLIRSGGSIAGMTRTVRHVGESSRIVRDAPTPPARASFLERLGDRIATMVGFFVALAMVGFGVTHFLPRQLDVISDTVSDSFGRAFLTGLLAQPLAVPAVAITVVALSITVIGIPVAILGLVVLPFALAAIALVGYLAVARSVGQFYLVRRQAHGGSMAVTPYRSMVVGLAWVLAVWGPAALLAWIPIVGQLLTVLALVTTWSAATAGLGAAILSRAGLRATFAKPGRAAALTDEHYWPVEAHRLPVHRSDR